MQLDTIGKNIRKYRLMKKFRQEDLAEKAGLTTNYIGMVERGEKIPSLETFIKILNALEVSSDMVLTDVLETGYTVKNSILNEKLAKLAPEDRSKIYEVIDTLLKHSNNTQHDTTKKRSHKSGSSCYFRGMRGYISISKSSGFRRLPGTAIFL